MQYESGMEPVTILSKLSQTTKILFHLEPLNHCICLERLYDSYFEHYAYVLAKTPQVQDLKKCEKN